MKALLQGKNVLLTGAGRNIGRNIAIEMGKEGAHIYFTEIDPKQMAALGEELASVGSVSKGFHLDVAESKDTDLLCDWLVDNGISIDILVNNVGMEVEEAFTTSFSLEEWHRVFDTNVLGPAYLTKRVSQMMIDRHIHGSILFVTSIHQWVIRRIPSYSASKAALGMIIKELAVELAPYKIRVNGIAPGYVKEGADGIPVEHEYTPLHGSSINPCYIGRAAVYLSSDYFSKFTTGTVLKIDAGLSLYNHLVDIIPPK
jgi:NAD(P)-dependent dehydrogenase (short-subunit alcohol dehydrogenase family)